MAALDTIVKLFRLGQEGRGGTEAEMLAAITKARQLMARHKIREAEVQAALDASTGTSAPRIEINRYTAYTRKIRQLARYDEVVSFAVGEVTDTEPIVNKTITMSGTYTSMTFLGDARYTALAGELFMIWLAEVRRAARKVYGSEKWGVHHTSYAIGFAARILDRAKAAKDDPDTMTPADTMALARISDDTAAAIARWKAEKHLTLTTAKRNTKIASSAYQFGYIDGGDFNMATKVIR